MEDDKNGASITLSWRQLARSKEDFMAQLSENPFALYDIVDRKGKKLFKVISQPVADKLLRKLYQDSDNSAQIDPETLDMIENIHRVVCLNKGAIQKVDEDVSLDFSESQ